MFNFISYKKIINKFSKSSIVVFLGVILYSAYFTTASFLRYTNFYTGRFDLGNMDQVVWNTVHGRIFEFTNPDGTQIVSRLAFHADFLLILLSPFYIIWQDPRMLLLIQTIILAAGAVFVYLIAKQVLKNNPLAATLAIAYLLNPSLEHSNLYDFHAVVPATTFVLAAWYFLIKKKFWLPLLFLLLIGISKEEAWAATGLIGLYAFFNTSKKIRWAIFTMFSFFMLFFLILYAIPHARGGYHFALSYYGELGSSPKEILHTIFFSPFKTFLIATHPWKLFYLVQLFMPVGFIIVANPLALAFALPDLLINLLSSNSQLHQIYFQYTALITPFIFISAIYSLRWIINKFKKLPKILLIGYLLITCLLSAYFFGPLPLAIGHNTDMFTKSLPDKDFIDDFLRRIPIRYSIAATNTVGSHLSHRQKIYTIPTGLKEADIIVFLHNDAYAQPSPHAQKQMAKGLEKDSNYVQVITDGTFEVFAKKNLNIKFRMNPRKKIQSPFLSFLQQFFLQTKM